MLVYIIRAEQPLFRRSVFLALSIMRCCVLFAFLLAIHSATATGDLSQLTSQFSGKLQMLTSKLGPLLQQGQGMSGGSKQLLQGFDISSLIKQLQGSFDINQIKKQLQGSFDFSQITNQLQSKLGGLKGGGGMMSKSKKSSQSYGPYP